MVRGVLRMLQKGEVSYHRRTSWVYRTDRHVEYAAGGVKEEEEEMAVVLLYHLQDSRGLPFSRVHYLQEASTSVCLYKGGLVWTHSICQKVELFCRHKQGHTLEN